jgi:hypothetical protein
MALVKSFVEEYMPANEITRYSTKPTGTPINGMYLILDHPIKALNKFIVNVCYRLHHGNYGHFRMSVANEGGAILAALLAAGYTPMEVVALFSTGVLDIVNLVEGGQKLPDALHMKKKGALHKGLRLRAKIDELMRAKIGGNPNEDVSFETLFNAGKRLPLYITVLDVTTAAIVPLGYDNHPRMAVADAVLASCAIQPYIGAVQYKDVDGSSHTFMSCSIKQSLPLQTAAQIFKSVNATGNFQSLVVAFGSNGTENEAGVRGASGSDLYKYILSQRAQAVVPEQMRRVVCLF